MKQLAKALRETMDRRGDSFREAAMAMGVASGTVVNWSKGWVEKSPRLEHWKPLAEYLEVPMPVILGWMGLLNEEQVELVRTIPGYFNPQRALEVSAVA